MRWQGLDHGKAGDHVRVWIILATYHAGHLPVTVAVMALLAALEVVLTLLGRRMVLGSSKMSACTRNWNWNSYARFRVAHTLEFLRTDMCSQATSPGV